MARRYILYVNTANLPKTKAQEFVKECVESFRTPNPQGITWLKPDDIMIGIAITEGNTHLQEYDN